MHKSRSFSLSSWSPIRPTSKPPYLLPRPSALCLRKGCFYLVVASHPLLPATISETREKFTRFPFFCTHLIRPRNADKASLFKHRTAAKRKGDARLRVSVWPTQLTPQIIRARRVKQAFFCRATFKSLTRHIYRLLSTNGPRMQH